MPSCTFPTVPPYPHYCSCSLATVAEAYTVVQPAGEGTPAAIKAMAARSTLPLWTFNVQSSRVGNNYRGVMVGTNPFSGGDGQTAVATDIPAGTGLANSPSVFGDCGPLGIVNYFSFSKLLNNSLLPALRSQGVNPSTFPIFLMYNVVMSIGRLTNLNRCCILGFHGAHSRGVSTPAQTFSPLDFYDRSLRPRYLGYRIMAHEVGEWLDDPLGNNPTPVWGHTGQVGGCQGNLEVGDYVNRYRDPARHYAERFTYHLQELTFFSWFYGAPSVGVNGWFSDNGTFTTDAGPPCQ
jgi:hypothetical protein